MRRRHVAGDRSDDRHRHAANGTARIATGLAAQRGGDPRGRFRSHRTLIFSLFNDNRFKLTLSPNLKAGAKAC